MNSKAFYNIDLLRRCATWLSAVLIVLVFQFSAMSEDDSIQKHIDAGEYSVALELAGKLEDRKQVDQWLAKIATSQSSNGARNGALDTTRLINDHAVHTDTLAFFYQQPGSGNGLFQDQPEGNNPLGGGLGNGGLGNGGMNAGPGGVTAADFTELIDLIQNTVSPTSWEEDNTAIRPYPNGVFVDSKGTLKKLEIKSGESWSPVRDSARSDSGNRLVNETSRLRKVSLTRLQRQLERLAAQGKSPDQAMQQLAGIYKIQYLLIYPDTGDIVIAGPAGEWKHNAEGNAVNSDTGLPTLLLDDLVVCLRNAWNSDGQLGCSIDPRQKNLTATQKVLSTSRLTGKKFRDKLRETLGNQDISVHGIDHRSHAAQVLVEADYLMKLIGLGLVPSVKSVPTYWEQIELDKDGNPPAMDVARWWLTMNYDAIFSDEDRNSYELKGQGVRIMSESELLNARGERVHTGTSSVPAKSFADKFTANYEEMSKKYPVYAQLRNVFDMALIATLIREDSLDSKTGWRLSYFGEPTETNRFAHRIALGDPATQVESIINHQVLSGRQNGKRVKHTIVGVSGGVIYNAREYVKTDGIKTVDADRFDSKRDQKLPEIQEDIWWWD